MIGFWTCKMTAALECFHSKLFWYLKNFCKIIKTIFALNEKCYHNHENSTLTLLDFRVSLLPASCRFLSWLILLLWRLWQYITSKRMWPVTELNDVISQKTELTYICTLYCVVLTDELFQKSDVVTGKLIKFVRIFFMHYKFWKMVMAQIPIFVLFCFV
jgi:hypothetical protein